jgi:ribonuclease D
VNASAVSLELHLGDLPDGLGFGGSVAIDTETMGLRPGRDRLCVVQLSAGDGTCHLVQFAKPDPAAETPQVFQAPNLASLLTDGSVTKLFHFARFDVAMLKRYLGVACEPVYCTKIASKLARTYTDRHGLKDLCRDLLGIELSKEQQSSDWGAATLTPDQLRYAASDVLYLHRLRDILDEMLEREGRARIAEECFRFLGTRAALDLQGWEDLDIFAHS